MPKNDIADKAIGQPSMVPAKYNKPGFLALYGLVGLILVYIIGSRALDTGSYWEYLFTLIFLIISIHLLFRSITRKFHKL